MQFLTLSLASLALLQPVLGDWRLEFYESGCPDRDDAGAGELVTMTAGRADQETWCTSVASAHNALGFNIKEDNMEVTLFSDKACRYPITSIENNGCKVIPKTTVIEAVRVLPRK